MDVCDRRSNLVQTQIFIPLNGRLVDVQAELLKEAKLVGDLNDKLQAGYVEDVHSASVGSQKKLVMGGADLSKEHPFLVNSAHEFTLAVQYQ